MLQLRWNDNGDSAVSFLWKLYWHELRGNDFAYEFFPVVSYQRGATATDMNLFKGLIRYRSTAEGKLLSFFWLPSGISWGEATTVPCDGGSSGRNP